MCLPTDYYLTTFYYLSTFTYLSTYYQSTNYYLSNDIFLPSSYLLSPNKLENDLQGNGVIELKSNILVSISSMIFSLISMASSVSVDAEL